MADLLRRAERYVNAEEEMTARKQKTPWSGHQEENGGIHKMHPRGERRGRKGQTCLSKTLDINSPNERAHLEDGCQSRPTTTLPLSWTHAPEYLRWNKIRSPSSGQRR
ncbi:hypothetical protein CFOL_v3_27271 [Cephalotus follicularis]|uniref:Uncharacterized protein n=1 Tax=Cephalotus follicularis TaxID=3775 RepID=A0A1Q3CUA0_CEPFO|nr:hypothetical protein CFOL_v3_27271 [Cephalotus follicularis]